MKVLVVCDGDRSAMYARELRSCGRDVEAASDVPTALMAARRQRPDAVVASAHLPGGGGPLLVTRLRGLVHTALTPVVAVAGHEAERADLEAAGATCCLPASAEPRDLVDALQQAVAAPVTAVTHAPVELLAEPGRQEALRHAGLARGEADPFFDDIARVAADVLPAPTALVSLVDSAGQFFPGHANRTGAGITARHTALSHSFCQWAVTSGEPLVVEDSSHHPLLRHNGAAVDLGVSAYAGVPLVVDGATLGTVCAVDYRPRRWDAGHLAVLDLLARSARAELRLRTLRRGRWAGADPAASLAAVKEGLHAVVELLATARPAPDGEAFPGVVRLLTHFTAAVRP